MIENVEDILLKKDRQQQNKKIKAQKDLLTSNTPFYKK